MPVRKFTPSLSPSLPSFLLLLQVTASCASGALSQVLRGLNLMAGGEQHAASLPAAECCATDPTATPTEAAVNVVVYWHGTSA